MQTAEVQAISRAIAATGRPIALSLSPGKELSLAHLESLRETSQMWRISDDFWDDWGQLREQLQRAARWAPHQQPGSWADADMLPLGRIGIRGHVGEDRLSRFTLDEQRTLMSLWSLMRSPLMFGGHLPDTPPETLALLTNPSVLALRDGDGGREIVRDGDLVVWTARSPEHRVCGVFWWGDAAATRRVHVDDLGWPDVTAMLDLWSGEHLAVEDGWVEAEIPAHGVRLLAIPR